jgi:putative transposase
MKTHFSCAELAAMKLPGLPASERNMRIRVQSEGWASRQVPGKGGKGGMRTEYQPPKALLSSIISQHIKSSPVSAVTPALALPSSEVTTAGLFSSAVLPVAIRSHELKDWQRSSAEARAALIGEVRRLAVLAGTEKAIQAVVALAANGELPAHLQAMVSVANAKSGVDGKRTLSRRSLYRWMKEAEQGFTALAPLQRENMKVPEWAPALLKLFQQPQKPALKWVMEQLPSVLPSHITPPSYWAANRFIQKMSKVDVQQGRMGNREIKNIKPFVRRDTSEMWPADAYTADGHTFDAEVAHPAHGRPFRPEITTVLDIATRRVVGWSVDLAESTWSVLDALRHACIQHGIPAIFYVDNGSGFKNDAMSNETTGFMARLGITITHSLPYNSQARGLEERSHRSFLVRAAKSLPTYMGADMDREAKQKAFKITRADIKTAGVSKLLMPWNAFINFISEEIEKANNREHRGLPKIRDAAGKLRHQTPNEAWALAVSEGWKPTEIEAHEQLDLFRPYKLVKVNRGEVKLFGNTYFDAALADHHGDTVRVGYDILDPHQVWVRDLEGRLICVAAFEANKRSYFPQSFMDKANENRAKGRIKRAAAHIEEAEAELSQTYDALPLIEANTLPSMPVVLAETVQITESATRPNLATMGDYTLLTWLAEHPEDWTDGFRSYFNKRASEGSRTINNALDEYNLWGELNKTDFRVAV